MGKLWTDIKEFHGALIVVLVPILLIPLPAAFLFEDLIANYTYCLLIMGIYWVTEALPIAVTALIPMVLLPPLGVMPSDKISIQYLKDTNFLLLGGFIIAVAFEKSGLHSRLALNVLNFVGAKPRALMFGFMFASWFLSMWISNTATTTMMMPMVEAVIQELRRGERQSKEEAMLDKGHSNSVGGNSGDGDLMKAEPEASADAGEITLVPEVEEKEDEGDDSDLLKLLKKALMICVPFGASMGGVATLTGSDTNLILSGTLPTIFPDAPPVSFAAWLIYALPNSILMFGFGYLYMQWFYFGLPSCGKSEKTDGEKRAEALISRELNKLGKMRQDEIIMTVLFSITVVLWLFRDPGFIPGWAQWFKHTESGNPYVSDATVAVTMALICYMLPAFAPKFLSMGDDESKHSRALLDWNSTQRMLPWGVLILIGGGFALAEASSDQWSGFSSFVASELEVLKPLPQPVICLLVSTIAIFLTEITSNTATAALFIPILCQLSVALEMNPFYLTVPATIGCSLAFMLPVATPPNAIAFGYGHLQVIDMVKCGFWLNLLGICIVNLLINTYGYPAWGLDEFPDWANITTT